MKTPREKLMAFVALGVVFFTLFALLYFFYYDSSMSALANQRKRINSDQLAASDELDQIVKGKERLAAAQAVSLPADPTKPNEVKKVQNDYNDVLSKLLK